VEIPETFSRMTISDMGVSPYLVALLRTVSGFAAMIWLCMN